MSDTIQFWEGIREDGKIVKLTEIERATVMACPHYIFLPEHYKDGGGCWCFDRVVPDNHMRKWGYHWSGKLGRWR